MLHAHMQHLQPHHLPEVTNLLPVNYYLRNEHKLQQCHLSMQDLSLEALAMLRSHHHVTSNILLRGGCLAAEAQIIQKINTDLAKNDTEMRDIHQQWLTLLDYKFLMEDRAIQQRWANNQHSARTTSVVNVPVNQPQPSSNSTTTISNSSSSSSSSSSRNSQTIPFSTGRLPAPTPWQQ